MNTDILEIENSFGDDDDDDSNEDQSESSQNYSPLVAKSPERKYIKLQNIVKPKAQHAG